MMNRHLDTTKRDKYHENEMKSLYLKSTIIQPSQRTESDLQIAIMKFICESKNAWIVIYNKDRSAYASDS